MNGWLRGAVEWLLPKRLLVVGGAVEGGKGRLFRNVRWAVGVGQSPVGDLPFPAHARCGGVTHGEGLTWRNVHKC